MVAHMRRPGGMSAARRGLRFKLMIIFCVPVFAWACGGDARDEPENLWAEPAGPVQRQVLTAEWDTLLHLGGSADDTLLLLPLRMAATPTGVAVYDMATEQVSYFGLDGIRRWVFGRQGSGPDEFRRARDLKADGAGRLFVLDPQNLRVTVLDSLGTVVRRVPLRSVGHAERLVILKDGRMIFLTLNPIHPLVVTDSTGEVLDRLAMPWAGYARLNSLQSQGMLGFQPGSDAWVFGFSYGNGWFAFRGTDPGLTGRFIEHTPFPGMLTRTEGDARQERLSTPTLAAVGLSVLDSLVYVHFAGRTRMANRAIDLYRLETGDYVGSYRLPRAAVSVAVAPDRIYIQAHDPYPELLALRPRQSDSAAHHH